MGHKATIGGLVKTFRFCEQSGRPMSAFSANGDFVPRLHAHPLKADATAAPSFGRFVANYGHHLVKITRWN